MHNIIRTFYDTAFPAIPTQYDNQPPIAVADLWVRFSVDEAFSEQIAFGASIHRRRYGDATAEVRVPINTGTSAALAHAQLIKDAFSDITTSGVKFLQADVEAQGVEGREWVVEVTIPFYVDDVIAKPTFAQSDALSPTIDQAHATLRTQLQTQVGDVLSLPILFDNAPEVDTSDAWLRCAIITGTTVRTGSGESRTAGIVDVSIFTPLGEGDNQGVTIAEAVVQAFLPSTVQGVKFLLPSASSIGSSGRFWVNTVTCPFVINEN